MAQINGNTGYKNTYYTRAELHLGNQCRVMPIKSWTDCGNGLIQVVCTDGAVYMTHSSNVLLTKLNELGNDEASIKQEERTDV